MVTVHGVHAPKLFNSYKCSALVQHPNTTFVQMPIRTVVCDQESYKSTGKYRKIYWVRISFCFIP